MAGFPRKPYFEVEIDGAVWRRLGGGLGYSGSFSATIGDQTYISSDGYAHWFGEPTGSGRAPEHVERRLRASWDEFRARLKHAERGRQR